ncbi:MAG: competence/damage-inducible protein A [Clostridiales bacterium]|nr:competence/damage-inducible protein A [Clostridiales bacterium]
MDAEIINVGSELLLGQIVNTDAQYISQQLSLLGINVFYHTVVGDNRIRLKEALTIACNRADLIITTGGLGPTMDDLTKETVAEFLDIPLMPHQSSIEAIEEFFAKRDLIATDNNYKQAYFPPNAMVLPNNHGTAPGTIIQDDGNTFVILPGPPGEMIPMFKDYVMPFLQNKSRDRITSKVIKIYGIGEALLEEKVKDLISGQTNPTIAPLASSHGLALRLTTKTSNDDDPARLIEPVESLIKKRLGDMIYGIDDDTLEGVVVDSLTKKKLSLAVAESCTGGLIAQKITAIPGASKVFTEGVISYSNESKIKRLGVSEEILKEYGAVSEETAKEMVMGLLNTTTSDIGVAITGIAGPGGGSVDKPIGLVYISIANREGYLKVYRFVFAGNRKRIQQSAAYKSLDIIRRLILDLPAK